MSCVRKAAVSGMFYPGSSKALKTQVNDFLNKATMMVKDVPGRLMGMVVPHAGYIYSGQVAAYAYQLLKNRDYETGILIGPNHHGAGQNKTSVYASGSFETPLGSMEIDHEMAQNILSLHTEAAFDSLAHSEEHALEVQIPFLQIIHPNLKIVPIVMADYAKEECEKLAHAIIQSVLKKKDGKVLIIASSDLSHYHPYDEAVRLDRLAIELIEKMDVQEFYRHGSRNRYVELCGFGPVMTMLLAAKELGADTAKSLYYANSGDVTGDRSQVVGYTAVAIYRKS